MKSFVDNIIKIFWRFNIIWHILAVVITYFAVTSGFDWYFFKLMSGLPYARFFALLALFLGAFLPIILPIYLYIRSLKLNDMKVKILALTLGQAALLGFIISSTYKIFTGRFPPNYISAVINNSLSFHFGILRNGIIFGWPSSHTMVAFAMAFALIFLFPKNKRVLYLSLIYALFIGISTTMSYHWFSEFISGAIIGTVIGVVIGKYFYRKLSFDLK